MNKTRMVFGLAAAPVLPGLVIWPGVGLLTDGVPMGTFLFFGAISIGLAACWFMGLGSLFLVWLGCRWGVVERFHCLALCATLAFVLPVISVVIGLAISPPWDFTAGLAALLGAATAGLLFAPLGIFGGWVLWRIAIRPAAIPLKELAEAF